MLQALERSLATIVERHETLRTRFAQIDGQPVQVIEPAAAAPLTVVDLTPLAAESREAEARRWPIRRRSAPSISQPGLSPG